MEEGIGYLSETYAHSLSEFGTPYRMPRCGGWVLERPITNMPYHDAMGIYPLFCVENDRYDAISDDIRERKDLVSVTVVTDPLSHNGMLGAFNRSRRFKAHYIVDKSREYEPSSHHLRYAKKAIRDGIRIIVPEHPIDFHGWWTHLYENLKRRHSITGIQAFSERAFYHQLHAPGIMVFAAGYEDKIVSMLLFYVHEKVAYYHLGASSDAGYSMRASFALMDYAIRELRSKTIVLGGASGNQDALDGLSEFKAGWANDIRYSWLCEAIVNAKVYGELSDGKSNTYFPTYRGE